MLNMQNHLNHLLIFAFIIHKKTGNVNKLVKNKLLSDIETIGQKLCKIMKNSIFKNNS